MTRELSCWWPLTGIDFYNFNSIILLLQLLLLLLLLLQLILVFGGHNNADFLEYYAKYAALFSILVITGTVNVRTHVQTAQFANIPGNAAQVSGSQNGRYILF